MVLMHEAVSINGGARDTRRATRFLESRRVICASEAVLRSMQILRTPAVHCRHLPRTRLRQTTSARSYHSSSPRNSSHSQLHTQSSVNPDEIALFSRLSSQWWDERGEFKMLHKMNPVRIQFIREKLVSSPSNLSYLIDDCSSTD